MDNQAMIDARIKQLTEDDEKRRRAREEVIAQCLANPAPAQQSFRTPIPSSVGKARRGEPLAVFEPDRSFQGPQIKYLDQANALQAQPGVWAKVITAASPQAAWSHRSKIMQGHKAAFRPVGKWEATSRGCDVWVRYTG